MESVLFRQSPQMRAKASFNSLNALKFNFNFIFML